LLKYHARKKESEKNCLRFPSMYGSLAKVDARTKNSLPCSGFPALWEHSYPTRSVAQFRMAAVARDEALSNFDRIRSAAWRHRSHALLSSHQRWGRSGRSSRTSPSALRAHRFPRQLTLLDSPNARGLRSWKEPSARIQPFQLRGFHQ